MRPRTGSLAWLGLLLLLPLAGCATIGGRPNVAPEDAEVGLATYYASAFHGRPTASGEPYDENELTAAHRALPFGTAIRITNLENDRSVVVRVNDRGPFVKGRIVDVSRRAARALGMLRAGVVRVRVVVVEG